MKKIIKLKNNEINDFFDSICLTNIIKYYQNKKVYYMCSRCNYVNDRLYHCKMHFLRIHIHSGKPVNKKRKYKIKQ